jgi:hypothetical protein
MMKILIKWLLIALMILGITLSIINFISVDNMAMKSVNEGTVQSDGCYGAALNC